MTVYVCTGMYGNTTVVRVHTYMYARARTTHADIYPGISLYIYSRATLYKYIYTCSHAGRIFKELEQVSTAELEVQLYTVLRVFATSKRPLTGRGQA